MQEIVKGLIISEDLSLAADKQEEIDRSEVALYGIKNKPLTKQAVMHDTVPEQGKDHLTPPIMQLSKQCLNCSAGQTSMITELFKIASLAYAPTPIQMDIGHEVFVSRLEVLQKRQLIVADCKRISNMIDELGNVMHFSPKTLEKFRTQNMTDSEDATITLRLYGGEQGPKLGSRENSPKGSDATRSKRGVQAVRAKIPTMPSKLNNRSNTLTAEELDGSIKDSDLDHIKDVSFKGNKQKRHLR